MKKLILTLCFVLVCANAFATRVSIWSGINPDQNLWESMSTDSGTVTASGTTDTLGIVGGDGIATETLGNNVKIRWNHNATNNKIINIADPISAQDAATKEYVDIAVSSIEYDLFLENTENSGIGDPYNPINTYTLQESDPAGSEQSFPSASLSAGPDQLVFAFSSGTGLPIDEVRVGIVDAHLHMEKTTGEAGLNTTVYAEWVHRTTGGSETILATTEVSSILGAKGGFDIHGNVATEQFIVSTDRLVLKIYANVTGGGSGTITIFLEGTTVSHVGVGVDPETLSNIFVRQDGTKALTGAWDFGAFKITGGADDVAIKPACTYTVCANDAYGEELCDFLCDGTADDVQLNLAVDAGEALTNGARICLSDGTFTTAAPIEFTEAGTFFTGQAMEVTQITTAASSTFNMFEYNNDVSVEAGLWFDGFTAKGYSTEGSFFDSQTGAYHIRDVNIENVYIDGFQGADALVEDAEDSWSANANVTSTLENSTASLIRVGSGSSKNEIADAFGTGVASYENFSAVDFSTTGSGPHTILSTWIYSDTATSAGDLQILLDDTNGCGSPVETISIPALVADEWSLVFVDVAGGDVSAVTCVGLNVATDNGAQTVYIDDVRLTNAVIDQSTAWGFRFHRSILEQSDEGAIGILIRATDTDVTGAIIDHSKIRNNLGHGIVFQGVDNSIIDHNEISVGADGGAGVTGFHCIVMATSDLNTIDHNQCIGGTTAPGDGIVFDGNSDVNNYIGNILVGSNTSLVGVDLAKGAESNSVNMNQFYIYAGLNEIDDDGTTTIKIGNTSAQGVAATTRSVFPFGMVVNESGSANYDFRVETDTEANAIFCDSSGDICVFGGTTNYTEIAKGGDVTFVGTGGLAYGEISVAGNSNVSSTSTAYAKFTEFDTNGASNNTTPDNANDKITLINAGHYHVTATLVVLNTSGTAQTVEFIVAEDDTNPIANLQVFETLSTTVTDKTTINISGIYDAATANKFISIFHKSTAGANNITVENAVLSAVMVGGT